MTTNTIKATKPHFSPVRSSSPTWSEMSLLAVALLITAGAVLLTGTA